MEIEVRMNKWFSGFPRVSPATELVIHGAGGVGVIPFMESGARKAEYVKGESLFHAGIEVDGSIVQIMSWDKWCSSSSSGQHDQYCINVELANTEFGVDKPFSIVQYDSLVDLIAQLWGIGIPLRTVTTHSWLFREKSPVEFAAWTKKNGHEYSCPGKGFDWNRFELEMVSRMIGFKKVERGYEI